MQEATMWLANKDVLLVKEVKEVLLGPNAIPVLSQPQPPYIPGVFRLFKDRYLLTILYEFIPWKSLDFKISLHFCSHEELLIIFGGLMFEIIHIYISFLFLYKHVLTLFVWCR